MEIKPSKLTTQLLKTIINEKPKAYARIYGENDIQGSVCFYPYLKGSIMIYEIKNLPISNDCHNGIFAFHIHEGNLCEKPLGHYNPQNCEHPYHLGDLPPLFATNGTAWAIVYIDKFKPEDVIERTMIIHERADDFHSQPSGNSGNIIACGEIAKFE